MKKKNNLLLLMWLPGIAYGQLPADSSMNHKEVVLMMLWIH